MSHKCLCPGTAALNGKRVWCSICSEYCTPSRPCVRCELDRLEVLVCDLRDSIVDWRLRATLYDNVSPNWEVAKVLRGCADEVSDLLNKSESQS